MAKETGLICTGESVRAILDGRKSQTRRVIKWPKEWLGFECDHVIPLKSDRGYSFWAKDSSSFDMKCPYGQVGDRVWVRETWDFRPMNGALAKNRIVIIGYKADDATKSFCVPQGYNPTIHRKWRSSRFMPKWATRIWLEITGIRVERVQEISIQDLRAEGMQFGCAAINQGFLQFRNLWNSINAKRGYPWSDEDLPDNLKTGKGRIMYGNPWVWVLELKRISDGN